MQRHPDRAGAASPRPEPRTDNILARKLEVSVALSPREREALATLQADVQVVLAGEDLLMDGTRPNRTFVLQHGWAVRYKLLPDGRRQVLSFVLPGDIVGLREYMFQVTSHSVGALTDLEVSSMDPATVIGLFQELPRLAFAVALSASREGAMLEEHVVRIGRRSAYERMAHLFLELSQRLRMVGQARAGSFEMPVTQEVIADTLGLSIVHVNRTLKRLQREGLVDVQDGTIMLRDREALEDIADFESGYLHQERITEQP